MLALRVLAAASLVIAAAGCAKGTTGAIGSGGSDGGQGGSTPATGTMAGTMSAGGGPSTGGGSPASTSSGMGGAGGASSSSATSTSSSTGSGGSCTATNILISQIQSRGTAGGNDDFIELFNPTSSAITLDANWELLARAQDGPSYSSRWKGSGKQIPAHGHYLLVGSAYNGGVSKDDDLTSGVRDASSISLQHSGSDVDYACYGFTGSNTFGGTFKCHGAPADNAPHDDTTGGQSNSDVSIQRKNGGCAETGSDATDFVTTSPAAPHNHGN